MNLLMVFIKQKKDHFTRLTRCKYCEINGGIQRDVILESHLIIYRVKKERIEVLRVIHSQSSISRIRSVHKIKI